MSESYQVLIDHDASPSEASAVADTIREALLAERIIRPEANSDCVLTGVGYPPGPRLAQIYTYRERELRYWDMLDTIGVKLHQDRYINFFGFPVFEYSKCPACKDRFSGDHPVMEAIYDCVGVFINDERLEPITCPSCSEIISCDRWISAPDLGFCHVAVEFWNWPAFDASGWKLSIPDLLNERTGRRLVTSWGHM